MATKEDKCRVRVVILAKSRTAYVAESDYLSIEELKVFQNNIMKQLNEKVVTMKDLIESEKFKNKLDWLVAISSSEVESITISFIEDNGEIRRRRILHGKLD